jgi:hypothetical protein
MTRPDCCSSEHATAQRRLGMLTAQLSSNALAEPLPRGFSASPCSAPGAASTSYESATAEPSSYARHVLDGSLHFALH